MFARFTLGAALVAVCSATTFAQTQVIVTPGNSQGWSTYTQGAGSATIDAAHPRSGNGSAHLNLPNASSDYADHYNSIAPVNLADLTRLSYDWFLSSSSTTSGINPAMAL